MARRQQREREPIADVAEKTHTVYIYRGVEYTSEREALGHRMADLLVRRLEELGFNALDLDLTTMRFLVSCAQHVTPMLEEFCATLERKGIGSEISEVGD